MKIRSCMLFCYDFPHKKTQDFIFRLLTEKYEIKYVIAAPWQKLTISPSRFRIAPVHTGLIHPRIICKTFNIKYSVCEHDSANTSTLLKKNPVDIAIISGARILKATTINAAQNKILNIHPGLLPEVRGLDTLLWSIHNTVPIGITSHLVSATIDSGHLIHREKLSLRPDDTIIDISLRLLEKQSDILSLSLKKLKKGTLSQLKNLDLQKTPYHTKMTDTMEEKIIKKFPLWLQKFSTV